jgi:hypothetical protein
MVGSQLGGLSFHHFLEQSLGRGVLPLLYKVASQVVLGHEGEGMAGPQPG